MSIVSVLVFLYFARLMAMFGFSSALIAWNVLLTCLGLILAWASIREKRRDGAFDVITVTARHRNPSPLDDTRQAAARSYLVDARMLAITSFPGLFLARKIWIDDALGRPARCRRVTLRQ
jgi:hypothetical protein